MEELYLITGAAGHLGQALVRLLLKKNKKVRIFVTEGERHLPPGEMEVCRGDVRDRESLRRLFADTEGKALTVIHMAGVVSILSKYEQKIYDVNVTGTEHMLKLAMEYHVNRFLYVSSVHAIREQPKGTPITEISDFHPDYVVGHYAKSKAIATGHVLAAAKKGLNVKIVHPSGIMGPYDFGGGHLTALVSDYLKGALVAGSRGGYDFVDVRDVAKGIVSCMERGKPGQCYILSGKYYTVQEILDMLSFITGGRRIRVYLPIWFLRVIAPAAQIYYRLLKKTPLFTPYSVYTLSANGYFSHRKAAEELKYTTRPMEDTLRDTLRWMKRVK